MLKIAKSTYNFNLINWALRGNVIALCLSSNYIAPLRNYFAINTQTKVNFLKAYFFFFLFKKKKKIQKFDFFILVIVILPIFLLGTRLQIGKERSKPSFDRYWTRETKSQIGSAIYFHIRSFCQYFEHWRWVLATNGPHLLLQ